MKVTKISNAIPVKKLKGSLDMCDETEIGGWIIDEYGSNDPIEVNIFIDDEWVTRVTANIFRQDLLDAAIGNGQCAFYARVPDKFFDGVEHSIEIKESLTSWILTEPNRKFKIIANEISINVPELIGNGNIESQQYVNYKTTEILSIDLSSRITTILQSGLFNYLFYKQQTNLVLGIAEAIEHFLCTGAAQGLKPMPFFETEAYRQLNPDLSFLTNAQCFEHYVLKGRSEKRYYNRAMLRHDASKLRSDNDFDSLWYASLVDSIPAHLNCYEHYLAIGWRQNLQPNRQGFDGEFYLACYTDAQQSNLPPFLHYLLHKKIYLSTTANINHFAHVISESGEFDSAFYQIQQSEPIHEKLSNILHYIYHGVELKLDPNSNFSTEYYARKYPDILSIGMNPFAHYLSDGRREGRVGQFNAQEHIFPGKRPFDTDKPTVLVVCHEATKTGAPILGLRLIEQLSQQVNIISWVGKTHSLSEKETLRENFSASCIATIETFFDHVDSVWLIRELNKRFQIQVAVLNSVATASIGNVLFEEKVPTVALVHEYGDYTRHQVSQILFTANRIIVPSQSVKDSVDIVAVDTFGFPLTHMTIRHQGRCLLPVTSSEGRQYSRKDILFKLGIQEDEEMPAIVFGCGTVCIRKGVEYFIEAARLCKNMLNKPIRFVWVGSGYEPYSDFSYSVWLKSQIKFCDLEKEVFIFEETTDLAPFFDLADVFFLSSRLDPFPNIAIDSVCAGVPVVAFDKVTGFSEFILAHPEVGAVAPSLDVNAAAVMISEYLTEKRVRHSKNSDIIKLFSFPSYADFVWQECLTAIDMQQRINEESETLIQANFMDTEFYKSGAQAWQMMQSPEYIYVAMWARGVKSAKSRAGFNDRIAELIKPSSTETSITPLARTLNSLDAPLTHNIICVNAGKKAGHWRGQLSVAIHIHAYYIDSLASALTRFGQLSHHIWFCITTDTKEKAKAIRTIIDSFSLNADVEIVTNRGRDIGPFIMSMKKHLPRFDIVGHFHLKGSKHLEQKIVRQWQDFIFNTMIGSSGEIFNELLNIFDKNPKIGLLFHEDPCLSSWTKNFSYGQELIDKLGIKRNLPAEIEFPQGNMFVARTAALMPLMEYDWQWHDFMAEPVPEDGSLLHAIERITPIACEEAGYGSATIYNPTARRYIHNN